MVRALQAVAGLGPRRPRRAYGFMNGPMVDARAVHKHFGALHVLKGVDLMVAERELVFVIGPSGSGKSTLLRCLNRLEEPTSGSVRVDGVDLLDPRTDINHARQRIGMVFQSFNLYPHMTALGNVALALRKVAGKSRTEAEELGRAALARVGLADRAGHKPGELSGGQQQRVAIARAMATRCCCPPESSSGRCVARSASPTRSSA